MGLEELNEDTQGIMPHVTYRSDVHAVQHRYYICGSMLGIGYLCRLCIQKTRFST